jgi:hypothetical protein
LKVFSQGVAVPVLLLATFLSAASAYAQPDRFNRLSTQLSPPVFPIFPDATAFSNTTSAVTITLPSATRVLVGYTDNRGVFAADGHRNLHSSAAGCKYSDDMGDHWAPCNLQSPPADATIVGGPAVAARSSVVYYAVEAIVGYGLQPNRILTACSTDGGRTFSNWSIVGSGSELTTARDPSIVASRGGPRVVFVGNQDQEQSTLETWDATASCPPVWSRRSPLVVAGRQYPHHPQVREDPNTGDLYMVYGVERPVVAGVPKEQLVMMYRSYLAVGWIAASMDSLADCPPFLQPFSPPLPSRGRAQTDFVVFASEPPSSSAHGIVVWVDGGSVLYRYYILSAGTAWFNGWAPPLTSHDPISIPPPSQVYQCGNSGFTFKMNDNSAAFLPTVAALAWEDQSFRRFRVISWFERVGAGVRLMQRSFEDNIAVASRNLTPIGPGSAESEPFCVPSEGGWDRYISSVIVRSSPTLVHSFVFRASSRQPGCAPQTLPNHVLYQEVGVNRTQFPPPREWY